MACQWVQGVRNLCYSFFLFPQFLPYCIKCVIVWYDTNNSLFELFLLSLFLFVSSWPWRVLLQFLIFFILKDINVKIYKNLTSKKTTTFSVCAKQHDKLMCLSGLTTLSLECQFPWSTVTCVYLWAIGIPFWDLQSHNHAPTFSCGWNSEWKIPG